MRRRSPNYAMPISPIPKPVGCCYLPTFKLIFARNHKPALRSVDEAIRRRINLIPFRRKFLL